jgi:D-amino peptidase
MDVYIVVDLECISDISNGSMIRVGHPDWASTGRRTATEEVNVVIEGALAGGAKRIWVKDGHDAGENLLRELLHPAAELLSGTYAIPGHMPGLDESFDAIFLIGFHAMMGTPLAHFDHTVSTATISEVRLNETPVGEIGIYSAYAGLFGVPVVFATGDRAGAQEAADLLGDIVTVSVKDGFGRFSARVPSSKVTRPQIRDGAERALKTGGTVYRLDNPLTIEVDFLRSADADMAEMLPGADRPGARTVSYTSSDQRMALRALQAMIALGSVAASRWAQALYGSSTRPA